MDLLFGQNSSAIQNEIIQVTKKQGFLVNLHVENFEKNPLELSFYSQPQRLSADTNRVELLRVYRHYLLESGDIGTSLGPLTTMKPDKLDFNPHTFQYGGMFFYPLAIILKSASLIRYLHLTPDINFYITHPLEFRKFGLLGRGWIVFMTVFCAFLIFRAATEWENRTVGILSLLIFLMFPNSLSVARTLKPHAAGLAWTVLAFWYALRYQKSSRDKYLWISALAAGLATGTSLNYGIFGLFPILSLIAVKRRAFFGKLGIVLGLMLGVFILTNPYFFLSFDIVHKELAYHHWLSQHGGNRLVPTLINIFPRGMTWWMFLWFLLSAFVYVFRSRASHKILMIPPVIYFIAFMVLGGGNRSVRFSSALFPYFAMICAFGLNRCMKRWRRVGGGLTVALLGMSFVSSLCYLSNYWADSSGRSTLYQAGRWINTLPIGTRLGCTILPASNGFPPCRFLDYDILVSHDPGRFASLPEKDLPAYYVSQEPLVPRPGSYQLFKTFQPISLAPQPWFGPDPHISEVAPTIYIFERITR